LLKTRPGGSGSIASHGSSDCGSWPFARGRIALAAVHKRYTDQLVAAPLNFAKLLSLNCISLCSASPRFGCIACTCHDARKLIILWSLVRAQHGLPIFARISARALAD
jgi:hypothetical protein